MSETVIEAKSAAQKQSSDAVLLRWKLLSKASQSMERAPSGAHGGAVLELVLTSGERLGEGAYAVSIVAEIPHVAAVNRHQVHFPLPRIAWKTEGWCRRAWETRLPSVRPSETPFHAELGSRLSTVVAGFLGRAALQTRALAGPVWGRRRRLHAFRPSRSA